MSIEYRLGKTNSGRYHQLESDESAETIIKNMSMFGFGDCINFGRKNKDGLTFGSDWGLGNIGCFRELQPYTRLADMSKQDVRRLAARMYELIYMTFGGNERYNVEPQIDETKQEYQQILEELITLQETQKRLIASGEVVFPEISAEELAWQDLW